MAEADRGVAGHRPLQNRRLALILAGPLAALMLAELDQAVFATALPTVVGELGGVDETGWVLTGYILSGTLAMLVVGRLGDVYGRRRVFLLAVTVLLAGSVLGGLATTTGALILARLVQGLGGGGLLVLVQALVADLVPARRRAPVLSAVDAVFAVSALLGPVLGGWLTDTVGWRWAFWMNLPVGLLAVLGTATLLREWRTCVPASEWPPRGRPAQRLAGGLVDTLRPALRLLHDRRLAPAVLSGVILAAVAFGTVGYLPTYLQMVTGLSPRNAGLLMLALVGGLGVATLAAAQILSRTGRYGALTVVGASTVALGLALLAALPVAAGPLRVGACLFLLGAGIGCAWDVLVVVVQDAVPAAELGRVTAAHGFLREVGVLTGTAAVGAVFTAGLARLLPGLGATDLTPAVLSGLPVEVRSQVATAYAEALTPIFGGGALLVLAAAGCALLSRSGRLGHAGGDRRPVEAAAGPVGERP